MFSTSTHVTFHLLSESVSSVSAPTFGGISDTRSSTWISLSLWQTTRGVIQHDGRTFFAGKARRRVGGVRWGLVGSCRGGEERNASKRCGISCGERKPFPLNSTQEGHLSRFISLPAIPVVVMVTGAPIPLAPVSMPPLLLLPVSMRRAIVSPRHEGRSHHHYGRWGSNNHWCRYPDAHRHPCMGVRREREGKERETSHSSNSPHP